MSKKVFAYALAFAVAGSAVSVHAAAPAEQKQSVGQRIKGGFKNMG